MTKLQNRWDGGTIETKLEEGQTIEEVKQKFSLLREAYEEMRGIDKKILCIWSFTVSFPDQMTRIEFEADLLKDEKVEREEEVNKSPPTRFETNI